MKENSLTLLIYGAKTMTKASNSRPKTGLQICIKCAMWSYCMNPSKINELSSKIFCLDERRKLYDETK